MFRDQGAAIETARRTLPSRIALFLCFVVSIAILGRQQPSPAHGWLTIHGATAAEERTIDWAIRRYRHAGLANLPQLDVYEHASGEGCRGNLGLYYQGRIDLCTRYSTEPDARKFALHEIAHAWIEANGTASILQRFMRRRRIEAWDDRNLPWEERGIEQAAEVVTWGLGEGETVPQIAKPTDASTLTRLYELLTGREPITPAAS